MPFGKLSKFQVAFMKTRSGMYFDAFHMKPPQIRVSFLFLVR